MSSRVLGLILAALFACKFIAAADTVGTPRGPIESDAPILASCKVWTSFAFNTAASAKQGLINISLQSSSQEAIKRVRLSILDSGTHISDYTYVGAIAPSATTQLRTHIGPIEDPSSLSCSASYVEFEDGSAWAVSRDALPGNSSEGPVVLDSCIGYAVNEYMAAVGISFHTTTETATAVSFVFGVQDPFGNVSAWYSGTTTGEFSPGVTIEPKKPALNPAVFQSLKVIPQNAAWSFPISQSSSPESVRCVPFKVRLRDGSVWVNPSLGNIIPIPASD